MTPTHTQINKQTNIHKDRQIRHRLTDIHTYRDRHTNRQIIKKTHTETDKRQTDSILPGDQKELHMTVGFSGKFV